MLNINEWLDLFTQRLEETFKNRVWFIGLQGSYGRNEATENSDIDIVVILDTLSADDIQTYNQILDTLPHREKICGFLSGKDELFNWEISDLFQFCHDTIEIKGSLNELIAKIDKTDVIRAIKIGACNIYHGCVHNMLHDKSEEVLKGLYKSASFVIQAICYIQNGRYVRNLNELLGIMSTDEREILKTFSDLKNGASVDFLKMSEALFKWCQKQIVKY